MNILFENSAVKIVLNKLKIIPISLFYINKGRYAIVKTKTESIAILLKTEPFFNFGIQFNHLGEKGVGDSINVQHLKEMLRSQVKTIYTIFRDGKLYKIDIITVLTKSHEWIQKEGTPVRSFSIHLYERVEN